MRIPLLFNRIPEPALATVESTEFEFQEIQVVARPIDSFASEMKAVTFIKVDIEGHEPSFFSGARTVLLRDRPIVQFEENDMTARATIYRDLAREFRYILCFLFGSSVRPYAVEAAADDNNFYFVPEEKFSLST